MASANINKRKALSYMKIFANDYNYLKKRERVVSEMLILIGYYV